MQAYHLTVVMLREKIIFFHFSLRIAKSKRFMHFNPAWLQLQSYKDLRDVEARQQSL
jgi:hypothetical protein